MLHDTFGSFMLCGFSICFVGGLWGSVKLFYENGGSQKGRVFASPLWHLNHEEALGRCVKGYVQVYNIELLSRSCVFVHYHTSRHDEGIIFVHIMSEVPYMAMVFFLLGRCIFGAIQGGGWRGMVSVVRCGSFC